MTASVDGPHDVAWANRRLGELLARQEELARSLEVVGAPPQIDAKEVLCRRCGSQ